MQNDGGVRPWPLAAAALVTHPCAGTGCRRWPGPSTSRNAAGGAYGLALGDVARSCSRTVDNVSSEVTTATREPTLRACATSRRFDSERRLLLAIRRTVREAEGRLPSTAWIDKLLDERAKL